MFKPYRLWAVAATVLAATASPVSSLGAVIHFTGITHNNALDVAAEEAQLSMEVTSSSSQRVEFTFFNTGTFASCITGIYFEKGPLRWVVSVSNSSGVSFSSGGTPNSLPGGSSITPAFVTAFWATADNSVLINGVANGLSPNQEWVSMLFRLSSGKTFNDVVNQLQTGQMRVGVTVEGLSRYDDGGIVKCCCPTGGSESFVTVGTPEPATMALMGMAAGLIMVRRRR
jgi:hypothetical protein